MSHQIINFGCRLNSFEGEVIKQALGSSISADDQVVVLNSCAVTQTAEKQLRQSIRKIRRQQPDAKIIVTGCAAQIDPARYSAMKEVDHVLGNIEKLDPKSYEKLSSLTVGTSPKAIVNDIMEIKETAAHLVSSFEGRTRAFLEIQNGCNHRCTFCIIPFGRGNNRSVPLGDIVSRVKDLVANGYKEIVLTGVDISGYGEDLPGKPNLTNAIKRILQLVPDLPRLRLSSIDVAELGDDFLELLAHEPRLMPHLHLSIQAGDDMILKRMKRRHLREDVIHFCDTARAIRPDIVFGADIITGFPTETDEMFANTMQLVEQVGIIYLHVFPYSIREGTPAAKMPQVPVAIRKSRAAALRALGEKLHYNFILDKIGKTEEVIIESGGIGRTSDYVTISVDNKSIVGSVQLVHIDTLHENQLMGTLINA